MPGDGGGDGGGGRPAPARGPADLVAGGLAIAVLGAGAAAWRWLYPISDAGLLPLGALGAMACAGAFVTALRRRRALVHAVLVPGSPLARVLGGALLPGVAALATTASALPGLAVYTLTARPLELALFLALVTAAVAGFLGLRRGLSAHLRPQLGSAVCAPWAVGAAAALFMPAHAYAVYALLPLPALVDAATPEAAVLAALAALPARQHFAAELLALLQAGEAAALWALGRSGFAGPALLAYLGYGALVGFGIARSAVDVAALFVALAEREEGGNAPGGRGRRRG